VTSIPGGSSETPRGQSAWQVLCTATIQRPVRNRENRSPNQRHHGTSNQPESECENDHHGYPARAQPAWRPTGHETKLGRVGAIKCFEIGLMRQAEVDAFPRIAGNTAAGFRTPRMVKDCPQVHRVRLER
jgi:hypothetical protein